MEDESLKSCPRARGFWVTEPQTSGLVKIGRIRCKSWSCPVCGKINQNILTATIINAGETLEELGYRLYFTTLTLGSYAHASDVGKQARTAHLCFNKYWHGLRKIVRIKNAIHYGRFLERHESGVFHIHAIMASIFDLNFSYASYPDMRRKDGGVTRIRHKDLLVSCGLGYQFRHVPISRGEAKSAGLYAVKYASKDIIDGYDVPSGFRRYASSRAFALTHRDGQKKAEFVERIPLELVARYIVHDVDYNHVIKPDDFYRVGQTSLSPSINYLDTTTEILI